MRENIFTFLNLDSRLMITHYLSFTSFMRWGRREVCISNYKLISFKVQLKPERANAKICFAINSREKGMASLLVNTSSKNSSRSASPNRGNSQAVQSQSQQQQTANLDHTPKSRNAAAAVYVFSIFSLFIFP